MKKIIGLLLAGCFLISNCAYAKTYTVFSEKDILIEETASPDAKITYTVLQNGKSLSDYDGTNAKDVFVAYDETQASAEGKYVISFKTALPSGEFPIIIATGGEEQINESIIYYVNKTENAIARSQLDQAADTKQFLLDNKFALGINTKLLNESTAEKTAELFGAESFVAASSNYEDTAKFINKTAAVASLCKKSVNLFSDYFEYFDIPEAIKTWLDKDYLDAQNLQEMENMLTKSYNSLSEFEKDVMTAAVLVTVKEADGFGYTREIMEAFGKELGIDYGKVTDDVAIELTGNTYETIEKLNSDIEKLYEDEEDDDTKSSGSSKRGGGGGGISNITVNQPQQNETEYPGISVNPVEQQGNKAFSDLNGYEWAKEAIDELTALSVINGKTENIFAPADLVLREEFVKIAMRTANFANIYGEINFEDVSNENWFYQDVKNAYLIGIISGISKTSFGSGMPVSRQDMAVILYNILLKKGVSLNDNEAKTFVDEQQIADYAKEAVAKLSSAGIINGDENGFFNPKNNANRAEAAKMVYGILAYIER